MTIDALQPTEPPRDRYKRYLIAPRDGGKAKAYTRATTVADVLDDRYNLELWKMRQVAVGLTRRNDLLLKVAADENDKKTVNAACQEAMDAAAAGAAANTGTALHRILERVDCGELTLAEVPELFADVVERYRSALDAAGVEVVADACERIHVLDGLAEPLAGMADRHVIVGGQRYIADIKTGSGIDYGAGGFAVQLAIYAHATSLYDYVTETHAEPPPLDRERGLIIHVPAAGGDVTLHWLDIAAGREALDHALWARSWRKRKGLLTAYDEPPAAAPTPKRSTPTRIEPSDTTPDRTPATAPEGGTVDAAKVQALRDKARADDVVARTMRRWIEDGQRHKVPWAVGDGAQATERRYALTAAALALAEHLAADRDVAGSDAVARAALTLVIGDDAQQPVLAVGGLIGTLTIDQARHLWTIATTFGLTYEDDGTPRLVAA